MMKQLRSINLHYPHDLAKNQKIEFRALGSKTSSKEICNRLLNGEIQNVIVAKDSDLDDFLDQKVISPYILYSKGYSWENDVYTEELVTEQIESMILSEQIPEEIKKEISKSFDAFRKAGKSIFKIELIFRKHGIRFISELTGDRFFSQKNLPRFKIDEIRKLVSEKRDALPSPCILELKIGSFCPMLNNYGKLIESFAIYLISYLCRKYFDYKSIPKKLITMAMIDRFDKYLSRVKDPYYLQLVRNLNNM